MGYFVQIIQHLQFTLLNWNLNTFVLCFKINNFICQKKIKEVEEMIIAPMGHRKNLIPVDL